MHHIQKCEWCQIFRFNAESCPRHKHCCAGSRESAHSKISRCMSSYQLTGTVSGQTAFDKLVRSAALCSGGQVEDSKVEVEGTEIELMLKTEKTECQRKETDLMVKKN